jgi:hypothetical protein
VDGGAGVQTRHDEERERRDDQDSGELGTDPPMSGRHPPATVRLGVGHGPPVAGGCAGLVRVRLADLRGRPTGRPAAGLTVRWSLRSRSSGAVERRARRLTVLRG